MKSNLKKMLSMVLALVMSAASFAFTASAAAYDITIASTDLAVALEEGQGVGFYDETPNTLDNLTDHASGYFPLEVYATPQWLEMRANEWVKYRVTAPETGVYSLSINYTTPNKANVVTIRNEASSAVANLLALRNNAMHLLEDFGYLYLTEGENDIYVDNKGTTHFNLNALYLTKVAEPDYKALKLNMPATACNESEDFIVDTADGYNKIAAGGATVTFPIHIFEDGKYKIVAKGKASDVGTLSVTADDITTRTADVAVATGYPETVIGIIALEEGDHTLAFSASNAYQLVNLTAEYVASYETILTSETVNDGDVIARGTDKLEFTLSDNFKEVKAENVKIIAAGNEIDVEAEIDGKTLTVYLIETLDYETPYTLTLTGIKGEYDDEAIADTVITFTTSNEADDTGVASFVDYSAENDYEDVIVSGTVLSGTDKGVSGRTVVVKDIEGAEIATAVTGANGAFEINFTIAEGTPAGAYSYTMETDYADVINLTINYISKDEETELLGGFKTATAATDIKSILDSYSSNFGITTYAADMDDIADPDGMETVTGDDLFYNHFINKTFDNADELRVYYNKMFAMEKLNQQRTDRASVPAAIRNTITAMVSDEATCNTIGLNFDRVRIIVDDGKTNAFAREFAKEPICTTEADFMASFNALLDKYIRTVCKKEDIAFELPTETAEAYVGQGVLTDIKLVSSKASSTPAADVAGIELIVTATDAEIPATAEYNGEGTAEITTEEGTTTVAITFAEPMTAESFGTLTLTSPVTGGYTITLAGTATYQIAGTEETIDAEIAEGTYDILISSAPSKNNRPSGNGGGSVGGGGNKQPVNKPAEDTKPEDTKPEETKKGYFDDIADAKWAETMINTLTDKGILSENGERKFRPNDNITREEYVKMIVMVIGSHDENATADFGDVASSHWANSYLATAANLGIVKGDTNNNFGLGQNITRQDMAVIIYRVFEMLKIEVDADSANFGDGAEIAGYAKDAVNALVKLGVINGMGDNTFAPTANATRAQAAKVIYTMMEVLGI